MFSIDKKGYRCEEVDKKIADMNLALQERQLKNDELTAKKIELEKKLSLMQENQQEIANTLVFAQRMATKAQEDAEAGAQAILKKAKQEAQEIVDDLKLSSSQTKEELNQMRKDLEDEAKMIKGSAEAEKEELLKEIEEIRVRRQGFVNDFALLLQKGQEYLERIKL